MTSRALLDLYRHMAWADAAVWKAVLASDAACADARLRDMLYHLHLVQLAFLRTWRGEPRDTPYPSFTELPPMAAWARDVNAQALAHLETLSDATLADAMPVAWADMVEARLGRKPGVTSLGDTVLQVALHSQYHRGQANLRLRELGGTPPLVDYIAWVWFGRPNAEWTVH